MECNDYLEDEIETERARTLSERLTDNVASFGGSWAFLVIFAALILVWVLWNRGEGSFDPYPYLLMNLLLNLVAAIQAPIIMMSQRRQETQQDRAARAHSAHRLIHASEQEIRRLNAKLDILIARTGEGRAWIHVQRNTSFRDKWKFMNIPAAAPPMIASTGLAAQKGTNATKAK